MKNRERKLWEVEFLNRPGEEIWIEARSLQAAIPKAIRHQRREGYRGKDISIFKVKFVGTIEA